MTSLIFTLTADGYSLSFVAFVLLGILFCGAMIGSALTGPACYLRGRRDGLHLRGIFCLRTDQSSVAHINAKMLNSEEECR